MVATQVTPTISRRNGLRQIDLLNDLHAIADKGYFSGPRILACQQAGKVTKEAVGTIHERQTGSGGGLFLPKAGQCLPLGKMNGRGKMGGAGCGPGMQSAAAVLFKHVQADPGKAELPGGKQNVSGQGRAA